MAMSHPSCPHVHHLAVRRQLEKILAHSLFCGSQRMARFLRFAVEATLDGKAGDLKEYRIGVEVYDRDTLYDPRMDPIVRVEARRLRFKLKAYYASEGKADELLFEFPSGTYAPMIRVGRARSAPSPNFSALAVLSFTNLSATSEHDCFCNGLTEEVIHGLTRLSGMRVVASKSGLRLPDIGPVVFGSSEVTKVLTGSVRISGTSLRVRAQLIDAETGIYLWSETFDRQMNDAFRTQEDVSAAITRALSVQMMHSSEPMQAGRTPNAFVGSGSWRDRVEHPRDGHTCQAA